MAYLCELGPYEQKFQYQGSRQVTCRNGSEPWMLRQGRTSLLSSRDSVTQKEGMEDYVHKSTEAFI